MGIKSYTKSENGKELRCWMVVIDTINRPTGRRVQKQFGDISTHAKAERLHRELWAKYREEIPEHMGISTWGKIKELYLERIEEKVRKNFPNGFSRKVVQCKNSRLRHTDCWNKMGLKGITAEFVTSELDRFEIEKGFTRGMTVEILKECKVLFNFALDLGLQSQNPLQRMFRKKVKKLGSCLTREETNKLLLEAKLKAHPFYVVWLLSVFTGLRRSELAGLKWTDIDWDSRLALIQRQDIPGEGIVESLKDGEDRVVALHIELMTELRKLRLRSRSEFVISFDSSQREFERMWRRGEQASVLRKFCREIGIKEVTHHQLRATFITLALVANVPLGTVKEIAGHSSLEITDIYFRRSGVGLIGATDPLNLKIPSDGAEVLPIVASSKHQ